MKSELKFKLYEACVQDPSWQMHELPRFHKKFTGKNPLSLREDFCGTGKIASEWVKKSPRHTAVGLDLDPAPLNYGLKNHVGQLPPNARSRIQLKKQDVLKPTREKFDVIEADNFSFFTFHERCDLLRYARSAYESLNKKGTLFLEMAGGPGFIEPGQHMEKNKIPGLGTIHYVWEQHQYDPITKVNDYSIHFKLPRGEWLNDAFTYHWRLWEIREVREILKQAGFDKTAVLWPKDASMTRYEEREYTTDAEVWLAYVVGIRLK